MAKLKDYLVYKLLLWACAALYWACAALYTGLLLALASLPFIALLRVCGSQD